MHSDPAFVLATLLKHGLALVPVEELPLEWLPAYEAMRSVRGHLVDRRNALETALRHDPLGVHKQLEIETSASSLDSPQMGQVRIYSAWETAAEAPVPDWIVKGFLTRPSLNLIVGAPGSKKTWLALDLAVCAASGSSWLGMQAQPTPVLFVDEEGGLPRVWERLNRVLAGRQAAPHIPLYFTSMARHNLALPNEADQLAATAQYLKAGLIIVDALANVMFGTDENNVLSVQPIFAALNRLAQLANAAVVVIHHTNKQGIFRGSTLMASGVDHMLAVESGPQDALVHLHTLKARDLEPLNLVARAQFEDSGFSFHLSDEVPPLKYGQTADLVMAYLRAQGQATTREISLAFPSTKLAAIRSAIHQLMKAGLVGRINGHKRGRPAMLQLTKLASQILSKAEND